MRPVLNALLLSAMVIVCAAHVGSPNVWYDGHAGPYAIRVLVRPPRVVPGLADIVVRVRGGASAVLVTPAHWDTGPEGAPPPDSAKPLAGDTEVFTAQLWLMARGAYRIIVTVRGSQGTGVAIVPVTAVATERLAMPRALGLVLAGGCVFLLVGLVSIVGSGIRESLLVPGDRPDAVRLRRARFGMATALIVSCALLFGGWRWWDAVDRRHRTRLDHPWTATASIHATSSGARRIAFVITDSTWLMRTDSLWLRRNARAVAASLIPDHGKLMHMFMLRDGDLAAFAHLHPSSSDDIRFEAALPVLASGHYRIYGDIVDESGEARTIVSSIDVPAGSTATAAPSAASDPDDAVWTGAPIGSATATTQALADGSIMRWIGASRFGVDEEVELRAEIADSAGAPVTLEPYMGMDGHAVISNADGSVFIHLHPLGTISMAAQHRLEGRSGAEPAMNSMTLPVAASRVSFPYAFPRAGTYRVWIQVKRAGRVLTGSHDVVVEVR